MNTISFDTKVLKEEDAQLLQSVYNRLKEKLSLTYEKEYDFNLKEYEILADYERADVFYAFELNSKNKSYITFTEIEFTDIGKKGSKLQYIEWQAWAIVELPKDFGHVMIKPFVFLDKIQELFGHHKIEFHDDKKFNDEVYVLAKDKEKAITDLSPSFQADILSLGVKEYSIEILGNHLIIGNKKLIVPEEALCFAKFVSSISL